MGASHSCDGQEILFCAKQNRSQPVSDSSGYLPISTSKLCPHDQNEGISR